MRNNGYAQKGGRGLEKSKSYLEKSKQTRKMIYSVVGQTKKQSKANVIYNSFLIIVVIISALPLCFKEEYNIFRIIDMIAGVLFTIDYILRFITADFKYKNTKKKPFLVYPFRLHAIIDLLSILSTIPAFFINTKLIVMYPVLSWIGKLRFVLIFKLMKCTRVLKLLKYSNSYQIIYRILLKQKKALATVGFLALAYIVLSAIFVFQIEPEIFDTFFDAVYWATISLTTVGYGDLYPVTEVGRLFSMLSAFFGIAFIALPAGIISAGYLQVVVDMKEEEEEKGKQKKESN